MTGYLITVYHCDAFDGRHVQQPIPPLAERAGLRFPVRDTGWELAKVTNWPIAVAKLLCL